MQWLRFESVKKDAGSALLVLVNHLDNEIISLSLSQLRCHALSNSDDCTAD